MSNMSVWEQMRYDEKETKNRSHELLSNYYRMDDEQVTRLKKALRAINPEYAEIIFYKYIDRSMKDKAIRTRLNLTKSTFYRKWRKALVQFAFAFNSNQLVAWTHDVAATSQ